MSHYSCVCVRKDVNGKLLQVPRKGKMIVFISVIIVVIQNLNRTEFFTVKY